MDFFSKQLPPYARVTFTGGEPLVFKGFDEVFHEVATKFECNMICNGLRLSEKIDFLLYYEKFKVLSISVDSVNNTVRKLLIRILSYGTYSGHIQKKCADILKKKETN